MTRQVDQRVVISVKSTDIGSATGYPAPTDPNIQTRVSSQHNSRSSRSSRSSQKAESIAQMRAKLAEMQRQLDDWEESSSETSRSRASGSTSHSRRKHRSLPSVPVQSTPVDKHAFPTSDPGQGTNQPMFMLIRIIEHQQVAFQQMQEMHMKHLQQIQEQNLQQNRQQAEAFRQTMADVTENFTKLSQTLQVDNKADQSSNLASGLTPKDRKDIAYSIATFEEPSPDLTCDEYLRYFKNMMKTNCVAKDQWAGLLYSRLRGRALQSVQELDPVTDPYDKLINAIVREFTGAWAQSEAEDMLSSRVQNPDEEVSDFAKSLKAYARTAFPTDVSLRETMLKEQLKA